MHSTTVNNISLWVLICLICMGQAHNGVIVVDGKLNPRKDGSLRALMEISCFENDENERRSIYVSPTSMLTLGASTPSGGTTYMCYVDGKKWKWRKADRATKKFLHVHLGMKQEMNPSKTDQQMNNIIKSYLKTDAGSKGIVVENGDLYKTVSTLKESDWVDAVHPTDMLPVSEYKLETWTAYGKDKKARGGQAAPLRDFYKPMPDNNVYGYIVLITMTIMVFVTIVCIICIGINVVIGLGCYWYGKSTTDKIAYEESV
eukprot:545514_1